MTCGRRPQVPYGRCSEQAHCDPRCAANRPEQGGMRLRRTRRWSRDLLLRGLAGEARVRESRDSGAHDWRDPEEPELRERPAARQTPPGPVERAGLTERLVTGMPMRWISVRPRPMAIGAKPAGARLSVAPRMIIRNMNVSTTSATRQATSE